MKKISQNKRIILIYYVSIFILLLYSLYKNGFILYNKGLVGFFSIFKPLIMVMGAITLTYLIDYIFLRLFKKDKDYLELVKNDYNPIYFALITLALPLNINILLFIFLITLLNIINNFIKQDKFNMMVLYKLLIVLGLFLFNKYNYLNVYEMNVETSLTTLDMVLGRSIGGIGTTSTLLLIIDMLILNLNPCYKKEIPISAIITFIFMAIISALFKDSFILNIKELINGEFLFGVIFMATIPEYSPIKEQDKLLFGVLIGIFGFICSKIVNPYEGVFIGILITNLVFYCQRILKKLYYGINKRRIQ